MVSLKFKIEELRCEITEPYSHQLKPLLRHLPLELGLARLVQRVDGLALGLRSEPLECLSWPYVRLRVCAVLGGWDAERRRGHIA